ncbi:MAG: DUF1292 domain-containing protein [Erysipelotrichales bacterium]|nr:DUF1292 domain-containing protein [Bacilli bacterium]MEA4821727.1 DUF1292 domain-containing protein [Erysipelotrichales bacterium]
MEDNKLVVIDEKGNEIEMEILFTFDDDARKKKYVIYFNPNDKQENLYASIYDDEGHLYPIEDDEEWDMVEEVIGTFMEENSTDEENDDSEKIEEQ